MGTGGAGFMLESVGGSKALVLRTVQQRQQNSCGWEEGWEPDGESHFLPGSPSRSHWQEVPGDGGTQGSGSL